MRTLLNRKTFEEGDTVIVKGMDRKGTINKRKGDFYNVTLDAAEEQEKNNVFAGDIVKASRKISSRFYMDNSRKFTLSEISQYLSALFFDLRTIHFNATGSEFYTYHELAQELYEQTEEYYDNIVETAISFDSDVSPMYVLPGDWRFVDEHGSFSTDGQVVQTLILERLQIMYDVLENVDEYDSMVQSKIDSMMEFYDKEIYKLKQAME